MNEFLYRDHTWGLEESLATQKKVKCIEDIKKHLNESLSGFWKEIETIELNHVGMDDRIGRDTYNVIAKMKWEKTTFVAGQTNGKVPENAELN